MAGKSRLTYHIVVRSVRADQLPCEGAEQMDGGLSTGGGKPEAIHHTITNERPPLNTGTDKPPFLSLFVDFYRFSASCWHFLHAKSIFIIALLKPRQV